MKADNHLFTHTFILASLILRIQRAGSSDASTWNVYCVAPASAILSTHCNRHTVISIGKFIVPWQMYKNLQKILNLILPVSKWSFCQHICHLVHFLWNCTKMDANNLESTLVQVTAWFRQATSHYLIQCWPRSLSPMDANNLESTLVQVMAWGCQATSHSQNQCWPRSMLPYHWYVITTVGHNELMTYTMYLQQHIFFLI